MAAEESNSPPLQPPTAPSSLPQYPEMILAAIEALNDKDGSNKSSISKQIEVEYGELPAAHTTLLAHHLNKMKQSGQLVMVKNNYMRPDPNAPPRRGRGRPPKPKAPLPPDAALSPPRPRGRPPKPRDPLSPHETKPPSVGSGRPRGRPPKKAKTISAAPTATSPTGPSRGRGRPPKVKTPAVAPVEC
ncbi:HMG-Y-related protein like [Actinidia chinensis var. chinensis]|uniref:HMG-Y-related protein A n=1 Tax=Actinidia chinensis var. chinensis TaxID=1590841 RepID=A0A2R6PGQ3_ACTCC|nr:HMG-Y-related protein like [Actinidia chinensis var. chinensis]